jgi:tetratricopeptide (TPR) repeat protein
MARFFAFDEKLRSFPSRRAAQLELGPSFGGTFMYYYVYPPPHSIVDYDALCWRLGNEFRALAMDDLALAYYRNTVWLNPQLAEAHLGLADLLKARGELEEAGVEYGKARKIGGSPASPAGKPVQGASERVE